MGKPETKNNPAVWRLMAVLCVSIIMVVYVFYTVLNGNAPSFYQQQQRPVVTLPTPPSRLASLYREQQPFDPLADLKEMFSVNLVLFLKETNSPKQREVEKALKKLGPHIPEVTVVDLTIHPNYELLVEYLQKMTDAREYPRLFIGGKPEATLDDILQWSENGSLENKLRARGDQYISMGM